MYYMWPFNGINAIALIHEDPIILTIKTLYFYGMVVIMTDTLMELGFCRISISKTWKLKYMYQPETLNINGRYGYNTVEKQNNNTIKYHSLIFFFVSKWVPFTFTPNHSKSKILLLHSQYFPYYLPCICFLFSFTFLLSE